MGLSLNIGMDLKHVKLILSDHIVMVSLTFFIFNPTDMASAAFIEPLPVIEFVAQLLGKDVVSRTLSDSDRIKVSALCFGILKCI